MIRVASYCRVSTEKEDQANSFESQQQYFREYIARMPDWELYAVYADEGITGTSTKKRTQFNKMIDDAYNGKFQVIITKEVSRFSRNILDTIAYTRALKEIGVTVQFAIDGINTAAPDAELHLSIMASMAQEESRKTSSRVTWGQTRQMEKGIVFGRSLLGYNVRNGKLIIDPEGAEIVRLIYHKYAIEQLGTTGIARFLMENRYCTHYGGTNWSPSSIVRILKNEKYVGDLVQKKSYTPNYLTHEKRKNNGQVPWIRIVNHHEGIIDRDLWDSVQLRLQKNNKHSRENKSHSSKYVFSGKIKCAECGSSFVGRTKTKKDGTQVRRWRCGTAVRLGANHCPVGILIRNDTAIGMLKNAVQNLEIDRSSILSRLSAVVNNVIASRGGERPESLKCMQAELDLIQQKQKRIIDCYLSEKISEEEFQTMNTYYREMRNTLRLRLNSTSEEGHNPLENQKDIDPIYEELSGILSGEIESDAFYRTILDSMTIHKNRCISLRLDMLPFIFYYS